jgi:hypothetical protein
MDLVYRDDDHSLVIVGFMTDIALLDESVKRTDASSPPMPS